MSVASILNTNGKIDSSWIEGSTSSGVQSISGGEGIIVNGGTTANPTVIARNQLENISEGEGIRVQQLALSTIISNDGVLGITAGSSNVTIDSSNRGYPSISVSTTGMDISAGLGIDISGTPTNPIITNNGIIEITAGEGINVVFPLINPDARFPTIVNRGIITMVDGTGINIDYTSDPHRPTVNSTGVLALTAGDGIALSGENSNITISATGGPSSGVASVQAGDGISIQGTSSDPIVVNTGVLALTAGTGVSIDGSNNNLTINATGTGAGVASVSAGDGITIQGTSTDPIVSNSGVLALTAGEGIEITGGNANLTITSIPPVPSVIPQPAGINDLNTSPYVPLVFVLTSGTTQNFTTTTLTSDDTGKTWYVKNAMPAGPSGNDIDIQENGVSIGTLHQATNNSNTSTQILYWDGSALQFY